MGRWQRRKLRSAPCAPAGETHNQGDCCQEQPATSRTTLVQYREHHEVHKNHQGRDAIHTGDLGELDEVQGAVLRVPQANPGKTDEEKGPYPFECYPQQRPQEYDRPPTLLIETQPGSKRAGIHSQDGTHQQQRHDGDGRWNVAVKADGVHHPVKCTEVKPHAGDPARGKSLFRQLLPHDPQKWHEGHPGEEAEVYLGKSQSQKDTAGSSERGLFEADHRGEKCTLARTEEEVYSL